MRLREIFEPHPLIDVALGPNDGDERVLWYPSAGEDYRDIMEMYEKRRVPHGIELVPNVYCHTDYRRPPNIAEGTVLRDDGRTRIELLESHKLFIRTEFAGNNEPEVYLMRIKIESESLGTTEHWVFRFVMENNEFLEHILLRGKVRVSHLVKVREGLGFGGGNGRSIAVAYGFLGLLGLKYVIADTQARYCDKAHQRLLGLFPGPNPDFNLMALTDYFSWSDKACRVFKVVEGEGELNDQALRQVFMNIGK